MPKTLLIFEVTGKQNYIFESKSLKENAMRSACIGYVTSPAFFKDCDKAFSQEKNLVYSGGGHTVVQFDDADTAFSFAKKVTERVCRMEYGPELMVKQLPYDDSRSPMENLMELSRQLEQKKAARKGVIRQTSFGIEKSTVPPKTQIEGIETLLPKPPFGYTFPTMFERLSGNDSYIAVIHIDGNGMGDRVSQIYENPEANNWDSCVSLLNRFSQSIQTDYEAAFDTLCQELTQYTDKKELPIRPVILAGDDMCFITTGSIGLACANRLLTILSKMKNPLDNRPYWACAGVAIVHRKFPFYRAYQLSEELCSNAKTYSSQLDSQKRVSAMDWHIEFGQIKGNLDTIREDYLTPDRDSLVLRPVVCAAPDETEFNALRSFSHFHKLCSAFANKKFNLSRSKLKDFRTALKQGEEEAEFYVADSRIKQLLSAGQAVNYTSDEAEMSTESDLEIFMQFPGEAHKRCLYFDAIELMDRCDFLN